MKNGTKILSIALSFVLMFSAIPAVTVSAADVFTEYISSSPSDIKPADISNEPANNRATTELPSSYDARKDNIIPAIRNQNPYGDCWAHAVAAAVEVSLIKQGLATTDIDLSELNLVENTYSTTKDKLGLLGNDKNEPIGYTPINLGGNNIEAAFELARWSGISSEAAVTQSTDTGYENADGYYSDDYYYALNEAQLLRYMRVSTSESRDTLKQLIMEYGIAVSAYYDDSTYRNNSTGAIYSTTHTGSTNHEITIIGWDDDYAVTNFNEAAQPSQPGAWLVRNSWGTWLGESGYCWLSYEDTSIDSTMAFFSVCSSDTYDNNYQYDGTYSLSSTSAWHGAANIYTSQQNEYISAVNLSLMSYTDTDITVRIYVNPSKNFLITDTPATTQTFHNTYEGIYTIALDNPVYVTKGTDFAVYYSFSSNPTGTVDSHCCDYSRTTSWSWLNMTEDTTNARSVKFNYNTCQTEDFTSGVWRIKAFTVNADLAVPDNFKVTSDGTNAVLSWDAVEGATAYEIYSGTDIGDYTFLSSVTTNAATLPVTDDNGIVVKYKVRAKNDSVTGDFCNARVIRFNSNTNISSFTIGDIAVDTLQEGKQTAQAVPVFTATDLSKEVNDIMVYYTVADESIATVTPTGEVTAVKPGTTTITGLSRNSAKTASATITVTTVHNCVAGEARKENEVSADCTKEGSYDSVTYCTICNKELSRTPVTIKKSDHIPSEAVSENINPASCIAKGSYDRVVYCSFCKSEISRTAVTIDMIAHTPYVSKEAKGATCVTDGWTAEYTCSSCKQVITPSNTLTASGHTPGTAVKENEVAVSCLVDGSYDEVVRCTVCTEIISSVHKTITAKGSHTNGEMKIENSVDATCKSYAQHDEVYYCSVCSEEISRTTVYGKTLAAHKEYLSRQAKAETCTDDGYTAEYTCSVCEQVTIASETIRAHHTPYLSKEAKAPTCVDDGYTAEYTCSVCKQITTASQTLKATGHKLKNMPAIQATCITPGCEAYTVCTVCGQSTYKETPVIAHNYIDGVCTMCGAAQPTEKCSHMCHKDGISGFIWKIINLFNKLFKINQYCECGAKHW